MWFWGTVFNCPKILRAKDLIPLIAECIVSCGCCVEFGVRNEIVLQMARKQNVTRDGFRKGVRLCCI